MRIDPPAALKHHSFNIIDPPIPSSSLNPPPWQVLRPPLNPLINQQQWLSSLMISWEIRFTFATNYIISTCFDDAPESQSSPSPPLPVRRMSLYCRCCCCCCWSSVIYRRRHNRKSCCSRMMKNFYSMNFFFICDVIPPTTPTCLRVYREEVGRLIPVSRSVIAVRNGTILYLAAVSLHCR